MISPLVYKDFYKADHRRQYPEGTTLVYSNFTARFSRNPDIKEYVVFGIQYFIEEYLINRFRHGFFTVPKEKAVADYKRRLDFALGKDSVPIDHIEELHDLQYLPIEIRSLPEGYLCQIGVPCMTIHNTNPNFYWLTNFIETILSTIIWGPMTSATIAHEYRKILDMYAEKTSDIPEFVDFQAHDFSMRGMFGLEAAMMSGAAHLLSFKGTDTIPAIDFLEKYYEANCEAEFVGGSVPATEHSVMCSGGKETELETYKRLITDIYPSGIVSIVSDTWDFWAVLSEILPKLKNEIMDRDGKLVIRPDSGDPVKIICGDYENTDERVQKGAIEVLWDIFGGEINSKGYKQLDSHIGLIYGDSITLERCKEICKQLEAKGFASTNIVFGVGSYTYQYCTRDTLGFAMKSTYCEVHGEPRMIYKDPKTDNGIKKSARGLLRVENGILFQEQTWDEVNTGELELVFDGGSEFYKTSLSDIRDRLKLSLSKTDKP